MEKKYNFYGWETAPYVYKKTKYYGWVPCTISYDIDYEDVIETCNLRDIAECVY